VRKLPAITVSEAQVKRVVEDWLDLCGYIWIRINPVRPFKDAKTSEIRFAPIRDSQRGAPDIIVLCGSGSLAVECKSTKGKLSPNQIRWKDRATEFGIKYIIVRDIEDLQQALM